MAQFLWPGGFVVPKCSCYTVTTGFLGQTTQANMYHTFWAFNPWTSYGPSPGKCPNCTHLVYTHSYEYESTGVHMILQYSRISRPIPRFLANERCPGCYLVTSCSNLSTHGPPEGCTSRLRCSRQDFACVKLQRILLRLHRLHSLESKIGSGQRRHLKRSDPAKSEVLKRNPVAAVPI